MENSWDPSTPIENLFKQIEDSQQLLLCSNIPFSDRQLVSIGFNIILESIALTKSCKYCIKGPMVRQVWCDFKIHFTEARAEHEEFESRNLSECAANTIHQNASEHAAMEQT